MKTISILCCFFLLSVPLRCVTDMAPSVQAKVVSVADGDSFTALVDGKQIKIRIYGIDAPEKAMPFYKVSKQKLTSLIATKTVDLDVVETDRYGRSVAKVTLPYGKDAASEMLKAGLVWHYKQYSSDAKYAEFEKAARKKRIGLWQDENPTPPWEIRQTRRKK